MMYKDDTIIVELQHINGEALLFKYNHPNDYFSNRNNSNDYLISIIFAKYVVRDRFNIKKADNHRLCDLILFFTFNSLMVRSFLQKARLTYAEEA
ncbi:hypothetical protein AB2B38_005925 [Balneola sp. MJW-20]|uniref:hypothetical protein n=1 Tax=Gracilimonas aurantiaca TaxID=3234185 RepID=UPI003909C237